MSFITREPRSGGKIVRNRRISRARTPYDRPRMPPPVHNENPNWVASATRIIATSAGKLLSSVFGESSSSSSSSSSAYSSSHPLSSRDASSDDEVVNNEGRDATLTQGTGRLSKENGTSSEMIQCFGKELRPVKKKSETMTFIEQLLMQESFTREECDRLIRVIRSRVVDSPTLEENQDGSLSGIPNTAVANDTRIADPYTTAMEARKWLEEKKIRSGSKSELDHGTCSLNTVILPHVTEGEFGSPVDVAKSYMQGRPLWASPSANSYEFKTPSPVRINPFWEEAPRSIAGSSLSSSKKRDSLVAGSWSILEEVRRVRAKATEDMLRTLPSTKTDMSASVLEHQSTPNSLTADTAETVLETIHVGLGYNALSHTPVILTSEQSQDVEAVRSIEGKQDSKSEGTGFIFPSTANGFPTAEPSLAAGLDAQADLRSSDEQLPNPVSSSHERLSTGPQEEENCELLSEASVEVPIIDGTDAVASDSQNSTSIHNEESQPDEELQPDEESRPDEELQQDEELRQGEELQQNPNLENSKEGVAEKSSNTVNKQGGKKLSRYNRKGRGRGRGRGRGK